MVSRRLLLILAGAAAAQQDEDTPPVLELTSHNFSATVDAPGARVLVEFYLPWCAFCKRLAPVYEKAARRAQKMASEDPTFVGRFARVDAEAELSLASQHGAPPGKGYPSLWWFADGAFTEYRGARTEDGLYDLVLRRGGPLVTRLNATAAVDAPALNPAPLKSPGATHNSAVPNTAPLLMPSCW